MNNSLQTAIDALKAHDFKVAFESFNHLHETTPGGLSVENLKAGAYAAQQIKNFKKGREWLLLALAKEPHNEYLKTAMVWLALAEMRDKGDKLSQRHGVLTVEELLKLNPLQPAVQPILTSVIMMAAATLESMPNNPVLTLSRWYARVDREALSTQLRTVNMKGKEITVISEAEKFYNHYCTMLYEAGRYEQCIAIAREGLSRLEKTGSPPPKWITRRLAMSLAATRHFEEAENIYSKHLSFKPEWYVLYEHARILHQLNRAAEAYEKGAAALTAAGEWWLKINVIAWMVDRVPESNPKLRLALLLLYKMLRQKNNTSVAEKYNKAIASLKPHCDSEIHADTKLDGFIRSSFRKEVPRLQGTINYMFDDARGGFIITADRKKYYFSVFMWADKSSKPTVGMEVTFEPSESFDKKTNSIRVNAAKIFPRKG